MKRLAFLLLVGMSLPSCSSSPDLIDWSEPPSGVSPLIDPTVVETGDTYRLEVGQTDDPNDDDPSVQLPPDGLPGRTAGLSRGVTTRRVLALASIHRSVLGMNGVTALHRDGSASTVVRAVGVR